MMKKESDQAWFGNNFTRKGVKGEFRGKERKAVERGIWLAHVKPKQVVPDGPDITREELDEAVERFLREGGEITQVPAGKSGKAKKRGRR